jgi:hypothetical protein
MSNLSFLGKFLMIAGSILLITGVLFYFYPKIPLLGKLPADIYIEKGNFHFYFPLGTCIVLSIIISLIVLLIRIINK